MDIAQKKTQLEQQSHKTSALTIRTASGKVVNVLNESPSPPSSPEKRQMPQLPLTSAASNEFLPPSALSSSAFSGTYRSSPPFLELSRSGSFSSASHSSPLSAQYRNLPSAGISDPTALLGLNTPRRSLTNQSMNPHVFSPYHHRKSFLAPNGSLFSAGVSPVQQQRPHTANGTVTTSAISRSNSLTGNEEMRSRANSSFVPSSTAPSRPFHTDNTTAFLSDKLGLKPLDIPASYAAASSEPSSCSNSGSSTPKPSRSISELKDLKVDNYEELSKYLGSRTIDEPMSNDPKRPFACPVAGCTSLFVTRTHRKRHIQTVHIKAKPFQCIFPGCSRSFSREDNMYQHVRLFHQRVPRGSHGGHGGKPSAEDAEAAAVLSSIDPTRAATPQ